MREGLFSKQFMDRTKKISQFSVSKRFSGREGLIIHQVSYKDGNRRRPLFYRMSLAELFIPYGDPRPPFHQKFVNI